jgi:hypothetical protein
MAIDRERARAAGYTDEEIDAYEAAQTQQPPPGNQPPPPPPASADQGQAGGTSMGEVGATMLAAAGPFGLGVATAAAAPLIYRGGKMAVEGAKNLVRPGSAMNPIGGGGPRMPAMGGGAPTQVPISTGPVAPAPMPAAAPAAAPTAAAQPSIVQRGTEYARQMQKIAAERVMQSARAAAPLARAAAPAAAGLGALTFSGGLNQGEDEELRRRRQMSPTITR